MEKLVVVVAYKPKRARKVRVEIFKDIIVDDILNDHKRKPLIPKDAELLDIGLGLSFEKIYKSKYKL